MRLSINLLQEAQQMQARLRRVGLYLQTGSIATLVAFGVVIFGLLSYTLILNRQLGRLEDAISEQMAIIESLRSVESRHLLVKQKLMLSRKALSEPSLPYEVLVDLYALADSAVAVGEVSAQKGVRLINLGGEADNVFSLVRFVGELSEFAQRNNSVRVIGKSFARSSDASSYRFNIVFEVSEE